MFVTLCVSVIAADVIPHLSLFISMMGAVASTFLALIFPPLCHMAVTSADDGLFNWRLAMNCVTLMLGALGFVTGTYASVYEIFGAFQKVTVTAAVTNTTGNNYTTPWVHWPSTHTSAASCDSLSVLSRRRYRRHHRTRPLAYTHPPIPTIVILRAEAQIL